MSININKFSGFGTDRCFFYKDNTGATGELLMAPYDDYVQGRAISSAISDTSEHTILECYDGVIDFLSIKCNAIQTYTLTVTIDGHQESHTYACSAAPRYVIYLHPEENSRQYFTTPIYFNHLIIKVQMGTGISNYVYYRYKAETFISAY